MTYPSLREQRFYGGFEKITLYVADVVLENIGRSSENPEKVKAFLASLYPSSPPVDGRDIVAPLIDFEKNEITYSIRRGHFYLSAFLREHKDPRLTVEHLTCSCHPGEEFPIFISAFPTYQIENGDQHGEG